MTYSNLWPKNEWALRHLNWTWVLYPLIVYIPLIIVFIFIPPEYIVMFALPGFLYVGWTWYLSVWNLKHKGRSAWNLLYFLLPYIGSIVFLCILNKDQQREDEKTSRIIHDSQNFGRGIDNE
ncbi:hypothetical protein LCGC14_1751670 [marine sediment metagenome]|uniref:Uncharacterized protein n=1 Tax=marine sediment metagenome TaxID=412755 RepID=A0A0F9H3T6_9ZZZZ